MSIFFVQHITPPRPSASRIFIPHWSREKFKMIRDGKTEGWLSLPSEAVLPWAQLNGVDFTRTIPGTAVAKGGALLAKEDITATQEGQPLKTLLTVPRDLILGVDRVREHANVDQDFREVLDSIGDFAQVGIFHLVSLCSCVDCSSTTSMVAKYGNFILRISAVADRFFKTPRGAILTFLLVQASVSCPHLEERVGVHSPFTE
jgi:hypothetical protein